MNNIWKELSKPIFVLAPMYDVTDTVFRQIIADCAAPDLYFTEFVSVDGLQSKGRDKLMPKLQFTAKEKPIIAQIWGLKPENYLKTTQEIVAMGFAGVDINMGCPEKSVVSNGCCAALINNRPLAGEIIQAVREGTGGKIPVSLKCRTGHRVIDTSWHEFLLKQKLDALIVHGRTVKDMSKVPNNWEVINDIRKLRDEVAPETVIIGNGDILTRKEGETVAKKYQLDGVMIGRGVFGDPFVFAKDSPWKNYSKAQRIDLLVKHIKLFSKTWGDSKDPNILKKFAKVYISDFEGASELRNKLMTAESFDAMLAEL